MKKVKLVALLLVLVAISALFLGCRKEKGQSITVIDKTKREDSITFWLEFKAEKLVFTKKYAFIIGYNNKSDEQESFSSFSCLYSSKVINDNSKIIADAEVVIIPTDTSVFFCFDVSNVNLNQYKLKVLIKYYESETQALEDCDEKTVEYWLN